jgi:hypothetical protein
MTQTINFRKDGNKLKLHFTYNEDIIDVMRAHKGYWYRKDKSWVFPESKRTDLYDELTGKGYNVEYLTPMTQSHLVVEKKKEIDVNPKDEDFFMRAGYCIKCKTYGFCFKDGLCGRCK